MLNRNNAFDQPKFSILTLILEEKNRSWYKLLAR